MQRYFATQTRRLLRLLFLLVSAVSSNVARLNGSEPYRFVEFGQEACGGLNTASSG
jgi:hypothetical protein